ncbi:hypothetical protein F4808DRAFT_472617 [Astrocystis sublimbata]|nr:hypothetical protein F4808DRAFT_467817 [Astrocystis sublimbata]KAI0188840.1 hypothetical protein F4808DRAFT_466103 [Astrocystis sublimbata]KAI0188843.1 hypothetical protein F4808DRAFT_467826 [Astrocystis sublimbata]KAI0198638.1 hypothetical protein F4808DRAFT_472617 [Astrocystis sublimbata]
MTHNQPNLERFEEIYKDIHNHSKPGTDESRIVGIVCNHLVTLGFKMERDIGLHRVVGVYRNGDGPTLMLRADMDAVPIPEDAGDPSASQAIFDGPEVSERPVTHAREYDMQIASLLAVASLLANTCPSWSGTLICVFQPNGEDGVGDSAMLDESYDPIPKPDIILARHVNHRRNLYIAIRAGPGESAADSSLVTEELQGFFVDQFGAPDEEEMYQLFRSKDLAFPSLTLPHDTPQMILFDRGTAVERCDEAAEEAILDGLPQIQAMFLAALSYLT